MDQAIDKARFGAGEVGLAQDGRSCWIHKHPAVPDKKLERLKRIPFRKAIKRLQGKIRFGKHQITDMHSSAALDAS